MDQDVTWYAGGPRPKRHCVRWGPSSPPRKVAQQRPHFSAMTIVAKRSPILASAELLFQTIPQEDRQLLGDFVSQTSYRGFAAGPRRRLS